MASICREYPELKSWVLNKQPQWILAGLCSSESKMKPEYRLIARKHTGNGESSHFQENNFTGRGRTLIAATLL
jgi:dsRNA-specific ribonuclease